MKKSFSERVGDLLKSLTGKKEDADQDDILFKGCSGDKDGDIRKGDDRPDKREGDVPPADDPEDDGEDIMLDDDELDDPDDDEMTKGKKKCEKPCKKSFDPDENDFVDATEVIKGLVGELAAIKKSNEDLGNAIIGLAEMVHTIGSERIPRRSVMHKSWDDVSRVAGCSAASAGYGHERPSQKDFDMATELLIKSCAAGRCDPYKSSLISHDMQKSMATGVMMKKEYYDFLLAEKEIQDREQK